MRECSASVWKHYSIGWVEVHVMENMKKLLNAITQRIWKQKNYSLSFKSIFTHRKKHCMSKTCCVLHHLIHAFSSSWQHDCFTNVSWIIHFIQPFILDAMFLQMMTASPSWGFGLKRQFHLPKTKLLPHPLLHLHPWRRLPDWRVPASRIRARMETY